MGAHRLEALALYQLSVLAADRGDMNAAIHDGTLSLEQCRELQIRRELIDVAAHLGAVYARLHQSDQACELWAEALAAAEPLRHPLVDTLRSHLEACRNRS
jgi:hypothetical protein